MNNQIFSSASLAIALVLGGGSLMTGPALALSTQLNEASVDSRLQAQADTDEGVEPGFSPEAETEVDPGSDPGAAPEAPGLGVGTPDQADPTLDTNPSPDMDMETDDGVESGFSPEAETEVDPGSDPGAAPEAPGLGVGTPDQADPNLDTDTDTDTDTDIEPGFGSEAETDFNTQNQTQFESQTGAQPVPGLW